MSATINSIDLGILIQKYFCSYLTNQRHVSKHTINSYRDTFRLLLLFLAEAQSKPVTSLSLPDLNAHHIIGFLQHLEQERGNSVRTRNARLAAIRSFLSYAVTEQPESLNDIQSVMNIPQKRFDHALIECLDKIEIEAILNVLDLDTWTGRRDYVLLLTLYNTGARVSEIIRVQRQDVDLQRQHAVHLHGKGRKERIIPLWSKSIDTLRLWLQHLDADPATPVFQGRFGLALTRSGVRQRLDSAVQKAIDSCKSLKRKNVSPHTIRHTTALHLLQSGVDLSVIALWLGHEHIDTTHQYMEINLEMKEAALSLLEPISGGNQYHRANLTESVLTFLESL